MDRQKQLISQRHEKVGQAVPVLCMRIDKTVEELHSERQADDAM